MNLRKIIADIPNTWTENIADKIRGGVITPARLRWAIYGYWLKKHGLEMGDGQPYQIGNNDSPI